MYKQQWLVVVISVEDQKAKTWERKYEKSKTPGMPKKIKETKLCSRILKKGGMLHEKRKLLKVIK